MRSTFHGLSAGAGKLGAVVGTFIYQPIADSYGLPTVMYVQAFFCAAAVLLTIIFLPNDEGAHAQGDENRSRLLDEESVDSN